MAVKQLHDDVLVIAQPYEYEVGIVQVKVGGLDGFAAYLTVGDWDRIDRFVRKQFDKAAKGSD